MAFRCIYGRAQKLVNVYLKSKLACGGYHDDERVARLHPPIDRKLLTGLNAFSEEVEGQDKCKESVRMPSGTPHQTTSGLGTPTWTSKPAWHDVLSSGTDSTSVPRSMAIIPSFRRRWPHAVAPSKGHSP